VPQNGHTSFCLPGFQFASPPHAGQANFGKRSFSGAGVGASASLDDVADDLPLSADALERQELAADVLFAHDVRYAMSA
jgi:hypothetical protein